MRAFYDAVGGTLHVFVDEDGPGYHEYVYRIGQNFDMWTPLDEEAAEKDGDAFEELMDGPCSFIKRMNLWSQKRMEELSQVPPLPSMELWEQTGAPMDIPQYCGVHGTQMEVVRPGKWQCEECDMERTVDAY